MSFLLFGFHFSTWIFFGLVLLLGIAFHFNGSWATQLQSQLPTAKRLAVPWAIFTLLVLIFAKDSYHFEHFTGHKAIYFSDASLWGRTVIIVLGSFGALGLVRRAPAAALAFWLLAGHFFAVDWAMSKEGHWFSSLYGVLYLVCAVQLALSATVLKKQTDLVTKDRIDWNHLTIAFAVIWFYLQFSQFIIIWMGNLPREATFYLYRLERWGIWPIIAVLALKLIPASLVALRVLPNHARSAAIAIIVASLIELHWMVRIL